MLIEDYLLIANLFALDIAQRLEKKESSCLFSDRFWRSISPEPFAHDWVKIRSTKYLFSHRIAGLLETFLS